MEGRVYGEISYYLISFTVQSDGALEKTVIKLSIKKGYSAKYAMKSINISTASLSE